MTEPSTSAEDLPAPEDAVGDPACALHRVCEACGALEDGPPAPVCGRCGTARPG